VARAVVSSARASSDKFRKLRTELSSTSANATGKSSRVVTLGPLTAEMPAIASEAIQDNSAAPPNAYPRPGSRSRILATPAMANSATPRTARRPDAIQAEETAVATVGRASAKANATRIRILHPSSHQRRTCKRFWLDAIRCLTKRVAGKTIRRGSRRDIRCTTTGIAAASRPARSEALRNVIKNETGD